VTPLDAFTCQMCAREFLFEADVLNAVREKLRRVEMPRGLEERIARLIATEAKKGMDGVR
jgi:hypothetical protein